MLLLLPPELVLHIFSYLDLPDLAVLSRLSPVLARLASDRALHNNRLRVVSPARVKHNLFGLDPRGDFLRPSVGDLCQRGVMRGLAIERRWRAGTYFYSHVVRLFLSTLSAAHSLTRLDNPVRRPVRNLPLVGASAGRPCLVASSPAPRRRAQSPQAPPSIPGLPRRRVVVPLDITRAPAGDAEAQVVVAA